MADQKPVVLITGCTNGSIGYALCQSFSPYSHVVYATSRRLASMAPLPQGNIKVLELDVTSEESVQEAVKAVIREEGRLDVVIGNAGGMSLGPLLDASPEEMQRSFDTNVFGMHRLARATIPGMIERRHGLFVINSSITALIPGPWHGIYSSGKAALLNYGEVLDMECRPFNVRVQILTPGAVRSNISDNEATRWPGMVQGSFWSAWEGSVRARMTMSQAEGTAMPTKEFADRTVRDILRGWGMGKRRGRGKLGKRIMDGGIVWIIWALGWVPRNWQLEVMWMMSGKRDK